MYFSTVLYCTVRYIHPPIQHCRILNFTKYVKINWGDEGSAKLSSSRQIDFLKKSTTESVVLKYHAMIGGCTVHKLTHCIQHCELLKCTPLHLHDWTLVCRLASPARNKEVGAEYPKHYTISTFQFTSQAI